MRCVTMHRGLESADRGAANRICWALEGAVKERSCTGNQLVMKHCMAARDDAGPGSGSRHCGCRESKEDCKRAARRRGMQTRRVLSQVLPGDVSSLGMGGLTGSQLESGYLPTRGSATGGDNRIATCRGPCSNLD